MTQHQTQAEADALAREALELTRYLDQDAGRETPTRRQARMAGLRSMATRIMGGGWRRKD